MSRRQAAEREGNVHQRGGQDGTRGLIWEGGGRQMVERQRGLGLEGWDGGEKARRKEGRDVRYTGKARTWESIKTRE